jgi:hypothetical protein
MDAYPTLWMSGNSTNRSSWATCRQRQWLPLDNTMMADRPCESRAVPCLREDRPGLGDTHPSDVVSKGRPAVNKPPSGALPFEAAQNADSATEQAAPASDHGSL